MFVSSQDRADIIAMREKMLAGEERELTEAELLEIRREVFLPLDQVRKEIEKICSTATNA